MRKRLGTLVVVTCCALSLVGGSVAAQTDLFAIDYYKLSGYANAPAEGVAPATSPNKLFEAMITPHWPAFQICVWTVLEGTRESQAEIYAKKMKWTATGVPSGEQLGKGTVKTKAGEVGCKNETGFVSARAAAEGDSLIIWDVQFVMKGNKNFLGYFAPVIWTFPFIPSAADETVSVRRDGEMSYAEFQEMRRQLLATAGAKAGPMGLALPE